MYAKVQKSPPPRPVSEDTMMSMGAAAGALRGGSLTPRTTRVRSAPWDPAIDEPSRRSQVKIIKTSLVLDWSNKIVCADLKKLKSLLNWLN